MASNPSSVSTKTVGFPSIVWMADLGIRTDACALAGRNGGRHEQAGTPAPVRVGQLDTGDRRAGLFEQHRGDIGDLPLGFGHRWAGRDQHPLAFLHRRERRRGHLESHPHGAEVGDDKRLGVVLEELAGGDVLLDDGAGQGRDDLVARE